MSQIFLWFFPSIFEQVPQISLCKMIPIYSPYIFTISVPYFEDLFPIDVPYLVPSPSVSNAHPKAPEGPEEIVVPLLDLLLSSASTGCTFFFRDELISHGYQWWWILSNGLMDNTYHKSNGYMDINYNQPNFLNINGYQWRLYHLIDISSAIESGCWLSHLNKYLASWDDHGANHHAKPLRKTCCKWGNPARGSW